MMKTNSHVASTLLFCVALTGACGTTIGGTDDESSEDSGSGSDVVDAATGGMPADAANGAGQSDATPGDAGTTVTYELDVILIQDPDGPAATVTSAPAGISCGEQCSATFPESTSVALSVNAPGQVVCGWSGSVSASCSDTAICTLTMNSNQLARPILRSSLAACP